MAVLAALCALYGHVPAALAQQPLDDVLKGFEEDKPTPRTGKPDKPAKEEAGGLPGLPGWIRLGGGVSQDISYNYAHDAPRAGETDHRGLSGLRSRIDLEADLKFSSDWRARFAGYGFYDWAYAIRNRDGYTDEFLDQYEWDADVGDAYIQGKLISGLDLKVGRQVVAWGKSESIRVVDILNPLDIRQPGRTDIKDLRLPVTMTKLDAYFGKWNLGAIAIHEIRFDKTPVIGSDFFTAPPPSPFLPPLGEEEPDEGFDRQEYALALNGIFQGWDLSLHGAYVFDDRPHLELTPTELRLRHSRLWMGGLAANVALGNWLLKGEAAYLYGIEFFAAPGEKFSRLDALAGIEYSGFRDTTISLEAANRHLLDFDKRTKGSPDDASEDDFQTAIRITRKYFNETLEVTVLASTFGLDGKDGGFQRLQVAYDWTDSVEVTLGVINYMSGEKRQFQGVGDNDRVYARIDCRF